ncbi:hypothetical protein RXV95_03820 [Novosphingobium sp. ZN18A2]|uniref:hypothetical protein n=1 Tax=Novosphingobium sp. ZN18A2 TaxID=3079861 RepID=UPI0030CF9B50
MPIVEEIKSVASLSSGLLARKGTARPAMRRQVTGAQGEGPVFVAVDSSAEGAANANQHDDTDDLAAAQSELGWDDHGFDEDEDLAVDGSAGVPEVLRQRDDLAESLGAEGFDPTSGGDPDHEQSSCIALTPMEAPVKRRPNADFSGGRRAAFTLRVDHERHLRLRLACALQNRSAQQVVTEALDRLLDEMPELDELARRARRH